MTTYYPHNRSKFSYCQSPLTSATTNLYSILNCANSEHSCFVWHFQWLQGTPCALNCSSTPSPHLHSSSITPCCIFFLRAVFFILLGCEFLESETNLPSFFFTCSPFCSGYFGDGGGLSFAQAGLKLQSSCPTSSSQVARITRVSYQHPAALSPIHLSPDLAQSLQREASKECVWINMHAWSLSSSLPTQWYGAMVCLRGPKGHRAKDHPLCKYYILLTEIVPATHLHMHGKCSPCLSHKHISN
jgi:hypothetical protein